MYKSKRFSYDYDEIENGDKNATTMVPDILNDPEFDELEEVIIGCWGDAWDEESGIQPVIDDIIKNKDRFANIKSLFFADMDYEECEVSWIVQGDYSKLWKALPQLEKLTIKGSNYLELGDIEHANLKELEIICGGLPKKIIKQIEVAKLPSLEKLLIYLGEEDYGFNGSIKDIRSLLKNSDFKKLTYLGITDSEIQDDVVKAILDSKYAAQLTVLDISNGTLTDKGGQMLCNSIDKLPNIKKIDAQYHYMSEKMMDALKKLDCEVNTDDPNEPDEYDGEFYYYPMLGE